METIARWVRENNQRYADILQLVWDGYTVEIGPGTKEDADGSIFTFRVVVSDGTEVITEAESHLLGEALSDVYVATPER